MALNLCINDVHVSQILQVTEEGCQGCMHIPRCHQPLLVSLAAGVSSQGIAPSWHASAAAAQQSSPDQAIPRPRYWPQGHQSMCSRAAQVRLLLNHGCQPRCRPMQSPASRRQPSKTCPGPAEPCPSGQNPEPQTLSRHTVPELRGQRPAGVLATRLLLIIAMSCITCMHAQGCAWPCWGQQHAVHPSRHLPCPWSCKTEQA